MILGVFRLINKVNINIRQKWLYLHNHPHIFENIFYWTSQNLHKWVLKFCGIYLRPWLLETFEYIIQFSLFLLSSFFIMKMQDRCINKYTIKTVSNYTNISYKGMNVENKSKTFWTILCLGVPHTILYLYQTVKNTMFWNPFINTPKIDLHLEMRYIEMYIFILSSFKWTIPV